jgi:hypothetical protein
MEGGPPQWPNDGPNGEMMEPDEDEQDPAIERDIEELEATVKQYGRFLPELLNRLEREIATDASVCGLASVPSMRRTWACRPRAW